MGGWRLYRVRYWFSAGRLHQPQSLRQDCCTRCILFRPSAERQCLVTYCIGQLFLLVSDQDGQVRFPLPCSVARQHMQLAHLRHGWPSFRHTSTTYQQFFISIDPSLSLANFSFAYKPRLSPDCKWYCVVGTSGLISVAPSTTSADDPSSPNANPSFRLSHTIETSWRLILEGYSLPTLVFSVSNAEPKDTNWAVLHLLHHSQHGAAI